MADFCAPCARAMGLPYSDFIGWLQGDSGFDWGRCEGCGLHLIRDDGELACAAGRLHSPVTRELCDVCLDLAEPDEATSHTDPGPVAEQPCRTRSGSEARRRTEVVVVRLLPSERDALEDASRARGVSMSALLRSALATSELVTSDASGGDPR